VPRGEWSSPVGAEKEIREGDSAKVGKRRKKGGSLKRGGNSSVKRFWKGRHG